MTFYMCFGKWGGFNFENGKRIKRVVLGYVSMAIIFMDVESVMSESRRE